MVAAVSGNLKGYQRQPRTATFPNIHFQTFNLSLKERKQKEMYFRRFSKQTGSMALSHVCCEHLETAVFPINLSDKSLMFICQILAVP